MSISWNLETFSSAGSTQDIVREACRAGRAEGYVARALEQNSGRGRHGRVWTGGRGNLMFSVLLRPDCPPAATGQIAIMAGLATGRACLSFLADPALLTLKWPNDVLLDGRKCAGILIEGEAGSGGMIVGVGVNISSAPLEGAGFLKARAGGPVDADAVLSAWLEGFAALYDEWKKQGFEGIRRGWLALATPKGSPLTVKTGDITQEGLFEDMDESGALLMRDLKGSAIKKVTAGDIYL